MSPRSDFRFEEEAPESTKERIDEGAESIGDDIAGSLPGGFLDTIRDSIDIDSE